jgi:hypothetical protein
MPNRHQRSVRAATAAALFGAGLSLLSSTPAAAQQVSTLQDVATLAAGHYWEQGWFAVAPLAIRDLAAPERVKAGRELMEAALAAGVIR